MSDENKQTETPDTDVIDALIDQKPTKPKATREPEQKSNRSEADDILNDLFSKDPVIASAALKKAARLKGISEDELELLLKGPQDAPEPDPEPYNDDEDEIAEVRRSVRNMEVESHIEALEAGVDRIMASKDVSELAEAYERLNPKGDRSKWEKAVRTQIEDQVVQLYSQANYTGKKVTRDDLKKTLERARSNVIGIVRQTIGDPSGLGRQASARSVIPGADITDEQTKVPSWDTFKKDPARAKEALERSNENFFARKVAALQANRRSTSA